MILKSEETVHEVYGILLIMTTMLFFAVLFEGGFFEPCLLLGGLYIALHVPGS